MPIIPPPQGAVATVQVCGSPGCLFHAETQGWVCLLAVGWPCTSCLVPVCSLMPRPWPGHNPLKTSSHSIFSETHSDPRAGR